MYPRKISDRYEKIDDSKVIDLLLISSDDLSSENDDETKHWTEKLNKNDDKKHYCIIKNFNKVLSSLVSKHHSSKETCRRCYNHFSSKKLLKEHLEYCSKNEKIRIEMPVDKDGNPIHLHFNNFERKMRVPFVVYADFECSTEEIKSELELDPEKSHTEKYQKHKPSGFCYLIKCFNNKLYPPKLIRKTAKSPDEDISRMFIDSLEAAVKKLYQNVPANKKYPKKTAWDRTAFEKATHCHICEGVLGEDKEWDHCNFTVKYRGAAHNLAFRIPKFIPVIFHNLAGYDVHLFIKNLGKSKGKIDCIPNSEEKYISFTK